MKYLILLIGFFTVSNSFSQGYSFYEKPIKNIENYIYKDVLINNKIDNIKLSGSLILPKGGFSKIVIIIPGSGRDGKQSHYTLAKDLLDNDIGVLRYEDRGVGASEGNYVNATIDDFSKDLIYAFEYLNTIFLDKEIGVIGHSLGASITLKANDLLEKGQFDFIVIMAGSTVSGSEVSSWQAKDRGLYQFYQIDKEPKDSTLKYLRYINEIIYQGKDQKAIKKEIKKYTRSLDFKKIPKAYIAEYYIDSIKDRSYLLYEHIDVPLFYIIGSKDRRIPAKQCLVQLATYNNKNIETLQIDNLGHYFTENSQFYEIESVASNAIVNWIVKQ